MIAEQWLRGLARPLPQPLKNTVRRLLYHRRTALHPAMRGQGVVQDLYYWRCDGRVDTVMLVHNYFSVFFPDHDTATRGVITVYDRNGRRLGEEPVAVAPMATQKLRMSKLLATWGAAGDADAAEGTVVLQLDIPAGLRQALADRAEVFYFWHRFYIAFTTPAGQPAYVHCVDKTFVYPDRGSQPSRWYARRGRYWWAPEMPLNIGEYERFGVVMVNRAPQAASATLEVRDAGDRVRRWTQAIPPNGARSFTLTPSSLDGLQPAELSMRVRGMPTPFGRPIVFKEFPNGTISVMHC
jgi:hypothetical protein